MLKRSFVLVTLLLLALMATGVLAQDAAATSSGGGMMTGLLHLHSAVRWVVVLIAVALLVKLVIGVATKAPFDTQTARLLRAFTIGFSIQWFLGLVLIAVAGFNVPYRIEHAVTMTIALVFAHMTAMFKRAPDSRRTLMTLIFVVIALVLVYVGIARLPLGWRLLPVA